MVVNETGQLVVIPKFTRKTEIKHPIATNGDPVLAAGEAEISGIAGQFVGIEINNYSGHYRPDIPSIKIGRDAFEQMGITFP